MDNLRLLTHKKKLNNAGNAERLHMSAQGHRRKSTQTSENGQGRLHEKEELNLQDLDKVEIEKMPWKNNVILPFSIYKALLATMA